MQPETGWSTGQRALLRFLEQQGVLAAEPAAPAAGRPSNADLFGAFADAIDQQGLVDLVSRALKIAAVELADFVPMPDLVALIPVEVARRGEVVPIAQYDGTLEVAAANPLDLETVKSVEFTTGLRVRTKIARRADVCRVVGEAYGVPPPAEAPPAEPKAVEPDPAPSPPPAPSVAAEPLVDADPDAGAEREPASAPDSGAWSFEAASDEPATDSAVEPGGEETIAETAAAWLPVDCDEPEQEMEALVDAVWREVEPEAAEQPTAWSEEGTSPDETPAAPIDAEAPEPGSDDVRELGLYDDVRLDEPGTDDVTRGADLGAAAGAEPSAEADLDFTVILEPEADLGAGSASDAELPVPPATPAPETAVVLPEPTATVALDRPSVLVVSRDLWRRVAMREALEADANAPCVLTMRDELEARATLALGSVAAVVVEGGALAADGRALWDALRGCGASLVVWGGRPTASDVVGLDRDTSAAEVAARVRTLLGETLDD